MAHGFIYKALHTDIDIAHGFIYKALHTAIDIAHGFIYKALHTAIDIAHGFIYKALHTAIDMAQMAQCNLLIIATLRWRTNLAHLPTRRPSVIKCINPIEARQSPAYLSLLPPLVSPGYAPAMA